VYALRDAKTNVNVAVIGEVDRATEDCSKELAEKLMTAYNHFEEMKEALVKAESALFYAITDSDQYAERQCVDTLPIVRHALEALRVQEQAFAQGVPNQPVRKQKDRRDDLIQQLSEALKWAHDNLSTVERGDEGVEYDFCVVCSMPTWEHKENCQLKSRVEVARVLLSTVKKGGDAKASQ
jgi:hypothetical protein